MEAYVQGNGEKTGWLRAKGEEDLTGHWTKNKKGERWVGLLVVYRGLSCD
jgi:hypothetical protein